jgi:hypothetical protein
MPDLFDAAPQTNGHKYDLFSGREIDTFRWIVAMFRDDGASITIRKANDHGLKTYYPLRYNSHGEPMPLWRAYLFLEHREALTINVCRSNSKFLKVISARDEGGVWQPIMAKRGAIAESLRIIMSGKFDDRAPMRRFYGKGSMVHIKDGVLHDKLVRLEIDVLPNMSANTKVPISIDDLRAKIELHKLAL